MITYRAITSEDQPFLYGLYASTRQDELAHVDWDAVRKEAFLVMQFNAQHKFYVERFPQASFELILQDGEAIGRLYLDRREDEIRIIDIALLPVHRGQGIGTMLMQDILDEGGRLDLPVRIHVERNNPALRLYHRLGFHEVGNHGIYYLMEWKPGNGRQGRE